MSEKYIDVRGKASIELFDTCAECKSEFVSRLHLRHRCGECIHKALNAPDGVFGKPWRDLLEAFDKLMKKAFD